MVFAEQRQKALQGMGYRERSTKLSQGTSSEVYSEVYKDGKPKETLKGRMRVLS